MTDNKLTVNTGDLPAGISSAIDTGPKSFSFRPQNSPEILRLDKEGMTFMGERITDAGEAYAAWMKTMKMMQGQKENMGGSGMTFDDGEPVAYLLPRHGIRVNCDIVPKEGEPEVPLYLRPQPKARLTDEEIEEVYMRFPTTPHLFAKAIEQKIWEKAE